MNKYAIIVAGGTGNRLESKLPKQFVLLNGLPVIQYSINAFLAYDATIQIILVIHPNFIAYWENIKNTYNSKDYTITTGGNTRFESVKNGLQCINDEGLVAVHDAARPLITADFIDKLYATAMQLNCVVPAVKLNDSIRKINDKGSVQLNRTELRAVQTPQIFKVSELKHAYLQAYSEQFTDDSSVMEAAGFYINLTDGLDKNIKITRKEDIAIAQVLFNL